MYNQVLLIVHHYVYPENINILKGLKDKNIIDSTKMIEHLGG
jgi:hypothetical protein